MMYLDYAALQFTARLVTKRRGGGESYETNIVAFSLVAC